MTMCSFYFFRNIISKDFSFFSYKESKYRAKNSGEIGGPSINEKDSSFEFISFLKSLFCCCTRKGCRNKTETT
jgi:hypothetical protein